MYFDRFDVCEAFACLAHDWGLYAVWSRLDRAQFKASPILTTERLEENAREIYDRYDARCQEIEDERRGGIDSYDPRPFSDLGACDLCEKVKILDSNPDGLCASCRDYQGKSEAELIAELLDDESEVRDGE